MTRLACGLVALFCLLHSAHAQRALSLPDLSALVTGGAAATLDTQTGSVYVRGVGRLNGLAVNGLARLMADGTIDRDWRPAAAPQGDFDLLRAANGQLYFAGYAAATAGAAGSEAIYSIALDAGAEAVLRYRVPAGGTQPYARLSAIAMSGPWLYLATSEGDFNARGIRISRIDTASNTLDGWSHFIESAKSATLATGADGSIFVVAGDDDNPSRPALRTLARLHPSTAQPLWQRSMILSRRRVAGTADGSLHVMVPGVLGLSSAIKRLLPDGTHDAAWSATQADQFLARDLTSQSVDMLLHDGTLYVTATASLGSQPASIEFAGFDAFGQSRARASLPVLQPTLFARQPRSLLGVARGALYFANAEQVWTFDAQTLKLQRSFPFALGQAAEIRKLIALPDGGQLIVGKFAAIYGGRRYRDVLRVSADGNVRLDWSIDVDGAITDAFLTPRGVVVHGGFSSINGVAAPNRAAVVNQFYRQSSMALVSLDAGAAVDPAWGSAWPVTVDSASYDGSDFIYGSTSRTVGSSTELSLFRIGVADSVRSADWVLPYRGEWATLEPDRQGGIWLFWGGSGFGSSVTRYIERKLFATRAELIGFDPQSNPPRSFPQAASADHMYIGNLRYTLTSDTSRDPVWRLRTSNDPEGYTSTLYAVSANYVYLLDVSGRDGHVLRRARVDGDGLAESDWSVPAPGVIVQQPASAAGGELEYVTTATNRPRLFTTRDLVRQPATVVEYLNTDVQRYFMTGRPSEQASLDARPASFVRTGMQFTARVARYYDDDREAPVCRFYFAPDRGGSNTHFYGTGEDCPVLNSSPSLHFEGYDFAVGLAVAGSCTDAALKPVRRLYNNRAAGNQSNHRYVVSEATRARMLAQGWIDEGIVFCAASVTDAAN